MAKQTPPPPLPQFDPSQPPPQVQYVQVAPPKKPFYKRVWFWLLAIIAVIVIVSVAGQGGDKPTTATPSGAASSGPAAPAESAAPAASGDQTVGLNTPVTSGDFEFTVSEVKQGPDTVGSEYLNQKAQGTYMIVTLSVKNIGNAPEYFLDSSVKLVNTAGQEFSNDSTAAIYASTGGDAVWLKEINPGNSVSGDLYFDVPAGFEAAAVKLSGPGFLDGSIQVSVK
ncbi:DUF4352 domain-containing protein [Micrococcales bacterium 31B]|nr:DUF4352 domain-containing protein [Micrococcales bacterium 31B]